MSQQQQHSILNAKQYQQQQVGLMKKLKLHVQTKQFDAKNLAPNYVVYLFKGLFEKVEEGLWRAWDRTRVSRW